MHFISGYLLFKDFCENVYEEPVPQLKFYEEVSLVAMLALTNTHTHACANMEFTHISVKCKSIIKQVSTLLCARFLQKGADHFICFAI